jgi:uncharacterized protein
VNYFRHPFRINVGFFINQAIGYSREFPFEFEKITLPVDFEIENLIGTIEIDRTQQGLRVIGNFSGSANTACGRCLVDFDQPLKTHFEELYTLPIYPLSEDESFIPEDGYIDFETLVSDFLALEVPINPVCKKDCRGLCLQCGQNLNISDCGHLNKKKNEISVGSKAHIRITSRKAA